MMTSMLVLSLLVMADVGEDTFGLKGERRLLAGGHSKLVRCVCRLPDGRILSAAADRKVLLWGAKKSWKPQEIITAPGEILHGVVSPEGKRLAVACGDGNAYVYELNSRKLLGWYSGHKQCPYCVAFSPDGNRLASGGDDGTARVWDLATGKLVAVTEPHAGQTVLGLAFSPDGNQLALAHLRSMITVWEVSGSRLVHTFRDNISQLSAVAFDPCGRYLAGAEPYASLASLWDLQFGAPLGTMQARNQSPQQIVFTGDGRHLITAGNYGTVHFWEVLSRKEYRRLSGFGVVSALWASADGTSLITGNERGEVHVWTRHVKRNATPLCDTALTAAWRNLGSEDPVRAWVALDALAARSQQTLRLIAGKFTPLPFDRKQAARLIEGLGAARYEVRQASLRELVDLGKEVEPLVEAALSQATRVLQKRYLKQAAEALRGVSFSKEELRAHRVVALLERIGGTDSRKRLEELRDSTSSPGLAREIQETLERIARKPKGH